MKEIKIELAQAKHYREVLSLFQEGFGSKFRFITSNKDLSNESIHDFGIIDLNVPDMFYVALVEDKVAGFIALKHRGQKGKFNNPNLPGNELMKKYGFKAIFNATRMGIIFNHKVKDEELYIDNIVVNSNYRGMGIGSKLLDFANQYGIDNEYGFLSLQVIFENEGAKKLYQRIGYNVVKEVKANKLKKIGVSGYYFMTKPL